MCSVVLEQPSKNAGGCRRRVRFLKINDAAESTEVRYAEFKDDGLKIPKMQLKEREQGPAYGGDVWPARTHGVVYVEPDAERP